MSDTATIEVLDALTIDQMAAGEVVERPASVAKELVENAFDAGAENVEVALEDGGLTRISVTDDGHGMGAQDASRCILRHATSKLRCAADLMSLGTLGFRGEALSSIAAVSQFTLTTRQRGSDMGHRLRVRGGVVESTKPVGCPVGTQIVVEELFYNVPARRKFMRAKATEQAHVQEALLKVALASRRGGIILRSGSRRLLDVPQNGTAMGRAELALGRGLGTTVVIDQETLGVAVSGVLAAQTLERGEGRRVWLFVNGRFVRDRSLQRAALSACGAAFGALTPTAIIYIDVPARTVDVNVHPQKLEVRFADGALVHRAVTEALAAAASAWRAADVVKHSAADRPQGPPSVAYAFVGQRAFRGSTGSDWRPSKSTGPTSRRLRPSSPPPAAIIGGLKESDDFDVSPVAPSHALLPGIAQAPPTAEGNFWQGLTPLGVAPEGYLCCRDGYALVLVNLKAAQSACLAHALHHSTSAIDKSPLMMPSPWVPDATLLPAVDDYLIETAQRPSPWGLQLEAVGPGAFVVMAVPQAFDSFAPQEVAGQLIVALKEAGVGCHEGFAHRRKDITERWIAYVLCQWLGPGRGSAVVWGPSFLQRLSRANISAERPVMVRLDSAAAAQLKTTL